MVGLHLTMTKIPRRDVSAPTVKSNGVKQGDHITLMYQSKDVFLLKLGIVRGERKKFVLSFFSCESYAERTI